MVGKSKHHANDNYYIYNPETKRIIRSWNIRWAPFQRPTFYNRLSEISRPRSDSQSQESDINDKNDHNDNLDQGGGRELDIES